MEIANSTLIARMDADDIAMSNRLKVQYEYFQQNNNVDILGSFVLDIDEQDREIELRKVPIEHVKISKLIWTCPFIHPTVMFKKSSIISAGSYNKNLRRRQDYDLWFRCEEIGLKFANIDQPLLYYRVTDEYYKKNNLKVQFQQARMGYRGAKRVNASLIAYFGISIALIKGSLPKKIRKFFERILKKIDPRRV